MKKIPQKFWERIKEFYSPQEIEIIKNWFATNKRKVSFRVNTLKSNPAEIESILEQNNIDFIKVDGLKNAYQLVKDEERVLWNLDIFQDGKIYLQSLSSQIPVHFLDLKKWDTVLDITAAPGSKTSQIAEYLENTWEVFANDNNAIRIEKLKFTLTRQWVNNTKVIKNDARKLNEVFKHETFDAILADLPCSAEWRMLDNNEKSFWFWSEENITKNATLQKEILKNTISLLKKWWNLVYSTCTIAPEENEEIVEFILQNFPEMSLIPIQIESSETRWSIQNFNGKKYQIWEKSTIRCLPSEKMEWFYIAKFRKN